MNFEHWPYLGVYFVLLATGFGLPIPEDVPLLTGGYLCHLGRAGIPWMILASMVGVLSGDTVLFLMGRRFGHHIVEHRFIRRLVKPGRLLMAEELFAGHGVKILFAGRFLPGLRPMIFMAAGILRVRFSTFILVNGFAASISVPTLVLLGKFFGSNLDAIKRDVRTASSIIAMTIAVVGLIALGIYLHRRQRRLMEVARVGNGIDAETLAHMSPSRRPTREDQTQGN